MILFDDLKRIEQQFLDCFNYDGYIYGIEDYRGCNWFYDTGTLYWQDEEGDTYEEDAIMYQGSEYSHGHSLALVTDCMGEKYLALLDNSKEYDEWE